MFALRCNPVLLCTLLCVYTGFAFLYSCVLAGTRCSCTPKITLLLASPRGLANAQSLCITLPVLIAHCLCLVHRCALPAPLASSTAWLSHPCGVHHCSFSMCTACTSYLLCITYASFSCALPPQLRNKLVCCPLTALVVPILLPLALVLVLLLSPCTGAHCTRALWCPYCCSVLQYGCAQVLFHWCHCTSSPPR